MEVLVEIGPINTHIYYHCNRIRDYDCKEPYITEKELIKQLITLLPRIKIDSDFLWQQFEDEIKRLNHLREIMKQQAEEIRLTPHNTQKTEAEITEEENQMLREYLLHILQFGTPEERKKILGGIKSKFELSDRRLLLR